MGQGQQKPVINPNSQQTNVNNSNPSTNIQIKDPVFLINIRQSLRNCSTNGYLTRDSFNQVLAVFQNLGFKRLRDTPLADRLFTLLDKNKSGKVSEQDFNKAIIQIINDKNSALMYTFRAYDTDGDNRIARKQFIQLIEDSWRAAFRILAQKCDGNSHGKITIRDLQSWAAGRVQNLNQHSGKIFNKLDNNNSGFIEFQSFREFITNSGYNDITAAIDTQKVIVPLNLTSLYVN